MAIRTPEQYLRSLNDGREIWFQGERAKDMSQHPHIRTCAEIGAMDYALCQDPRYQDLLLERDQDGEPYHFVFKPMEGSLAAQRMSIFNTADFARYKAAAKRVAGIEDGQQHPIFGKLPHFPGWTWRKKK